MTIFTTVLSDNIPTTDELNRTINVTGAFSEVFSTTDEINRRINIVRTPIEIILTNNLLARKNTFNREIFFETPTSDGELHSHITETIAHYLSDTFVTIDEVNRNTINNNIVVNDILNTFDTVASQNIYHRNLKKIFTTEDAGQYTLRLLKDIVNPNIFIPGDRVEFIYYGLPMQGTVIEILFNSSLIEQIVVEVDVSSYYRDLPQDGNRLTMYINENCLQKVSPPNW